MPKIRVSDEEFFARSIEFFFDNGRRLQKIHPDCTDEYSDHSLLKLMAITYWVGIFSPIAHNRLKRKYGYKVVYVDSMAGCGVTSTTKGDHFCGSCPGAVLSAINRDVPFDLTVCVEKEARKTEALKERLSTLMPPSEVIVLNDDIMNVSADIKRLLKDRKSVSYIVIDPQALHGVTWGGLSPLLSCKGDAMFTWFELEAWRLKEAALTDITHAAKDAEVERMNELFGNEGWKKTSSPEELTQLFIERVLAECGKTAAAKVRIPRSGGNYYWMILFAGNFRNAEKLTKDWQHRVEARIMSAHGKGISSLLDVKAKRVATLNGY